jgi:predicted DNA-binding transcriptional regulator AlpA
MTITNPVRSDDRLVRPADAAPILHISVTHLAKLRMNGGGPPFVKLGTGKQGSVRYRLSDLERWIESRTRRSTSDSGEYPDSGLGK